MVDHKNIHTSNIIMTDQGIFRNIYVQTYTNMYVIVISKKGGDDLKESREVKTGGFGGRKGNGEMLQFYYDLKK